MAVQFGKFTEEAVVHCVVCAVVSRNGQIVCSIYLFQLIELGLGALWECYLDIFFLNNFKKKNNPEIFCKWQSAGQLAS